MEKAPPPIKEEGAPEWMVTFSDCMTLLLTFFVLLLSFSSFEKQKFEELAQSFGTGAPGFTARSFNAFVQRKSYNTPADKGATEPTESEKPQNNSMKETNPQNFRQLRVFTAASSDFFLSSGKALSPNGKQTLDLIAKFAQSVPCRIVISETGQRNSFNPVLGLPRAYEIMNYLNKAGIPIQLLNISSVNTLNSSINSADYKRQVQITLLEREVYGQ